MNAPVIAQVARLQATLPERAIDDRRSDCAHDHVAHAPESGADKRADAVKKLASPAVIRRIFADEGPPSALFRESDAEADQPCDERPARTSTQADWTRHLCASPPMLLTSDREAGRGWCSLAGERGLHADASPDQGHIRSSRSRSWSGSIALVLFSIALAALLLPSSARREPLAAAQPKTKPSNAAEARASHPARFPSSPPAIEPLIFAQVDPDSARAINAATAFQPLGPDRPAPFFLPAGSVDFERARDCLASPLWYEAGDDRSGQQAVAQVVLNRMRHPAYPHSICAVVYQGAERRTGCQFTFACDGSLTRHPSSLAWARARDTASAFLAGQTDPRIGMATHYHTDWVHPYWSASLDKIAQVGTHLFFRWHGGWGRRTAFASAYAGQEPDVPKLAFLSPAHARAEAPRLAYELDSTVPLSPAHSPVRPAITPPIGLLDQREGDHFILVDATGDGSALAMQGLAQCRGQSYCKVVGWDRRAQGLGSPDHPFIRTVAFLYVSDRRTGVEIVLWDCGRYNRPVDSQCLSDANRRWITFQGDLSRTS